MITTVVIAPEVGHRQTLAQGLQQAGAMLLAETDNLLHGYELVRRNHPQLVFVALQPNTQDALGLVERITTYFKETLVVVIGDTADLDTLQACMSAGAREFLPNAFDAQSVVTLIHRHHKALDRQGDGDVGGRLLTVFSNKGGLGKTTITVNLGIALSQLIGKPVALVDLNLQLGDVATFLNLEPRQTIADIARDLGRVDAAYLEASLAQYNHESGAQLRLVAHPHYVEQAEDISPEQVAKLLALLKATYEYVIVDTSTSFDPRTLVALDEADDVLLLSSVNLPSIRSTQRILSLFKRLNYPPEKLRLILNRHLGNDEISAEDVEEVLQHPITWKIPNNYPAMISAINRGVPICDIKAGATIYENFIGLARQLTGTVASGAPLLGSLGGQPAPKSLLGRLFGRH